MNIKSKQSWFTRSISLFLVLIMILTLIPTTAFADDYTGGGDGEQNFTSGQWRANWNRDQQGIRISVVNHQGENMLVDAKTGRPYVVDFVFGQPPAGSLFMAGNKFESWEGTNGTDLRVIPVWQFNNYINAAIDENKAVNLPYLAPRDTSKTKDDKNCVYKSMPKEYKGIPRPNETDAAGNAIGNGLAVKNFFIKGEQGTFVSGHNPIINLDSKAF